MKWFRFWSEALYDRKVQQLSDRDFKAWVNLLCLANEGAVRGELPGDEDIAYKLRIQPERMAVILERLTTVGLLEGPENQRIIHAWDKRQLDAESLGNDGVLGNHERWHVKRGITSPDCPHCQAIAMSSPPDKDAIASKSRVDKSRSRVDPEEIRVRVDGEASAFASPRTTPGPVLSGLSEEPDLPTSDFAILLQHYRDRVGMTTTDQLRCLREYHGGHPDWAWAAVNETASAPTPSWRYCAAIMARSLEENRPPSSLAVTR